MRPTAAGLAYREERDAIVRGRQRFRPMIERFEAKLTRSTDTDCWVWHGSKDRGYGQLFDGEAVRLAHRVAYQMFIGPIPEGLTLDHLCQNLGCVNPEHLEPCTAEENLSRASRRMMTCRRGHPWTDANTIRKTDGSRQCRICRNASYRRKVAATR